MQCLSSGQILELLQGKAQTDLFRLLTVKRANTESLSADSEFEAATWASAKQIMWAIIIWEQEKIHHYFEIEWEILELIHQVHDFPMYYKWNSLITNVTRKQKAKQNHYDEYLLHNLSSMSKHWTGLR